MRFRVNYFISLCFLLCVLKLQSQGWQQKANYKIQVQLNVQTHHYTGVQQLEYFNNSPDTLRRVFFHLYNNAFQPGSAMDERSRRQGNVFIGKNPDWDNRVKDRIQHLKPDEIGYLKVESVKIQGRSQILKERETILEVLLDRPIMPRSKTTFDISFNAQTPLQIRRSGRDHPKTKVRYSMSQWYPKICEYDEDGWHPTPYVGREFYGVWGNFDVSISLDKSYILGATGYLVNADQIGYGYEKLGTKVKPSVGNELTWHFMAPNVHDFVWAADPEFVHKTKTVRPNLIFHLLYKPTTAASEEWEQVLDEAARALPYIESTFGPYPYEQFSFIHGGDGGMEYPMATLLYGPGAWLHEWLHNWYYGVLASNESLYPWMDEGFTTYAESRVTAYLKKDSNFAFTDDYKSYQALAKSGREEPLTTHADHYNTNAAYGAAVYSKGAVFLEQLGYIVGADTRDKILINYYQAWKFKHPKPSDFIRIAERLSGIKLDWYKDFWIHSTKTIDYRVDSVWQEIPGATQIRLKNNGFMPMPQDILLTFKDGHQELHYIPLDLMMGAKQNERNEQKFFLHEPWKWTQPWYVFSVNTAVSDLLRIELDPSQRMADLDRKNNQINFK